MGTCSSETSGVEIKSNGAMETDVFSGKRVPWTNLVLILSLCRRHWEQLSPQEG